MKAYRVWWRDQDDSTPVVVANSYAEALKLAYEEIEVGLSEIEDAVQCPRCENVFDDLKETQKCPECKDETLEAV